MSGSARAPLTGGQPSARPQRRRAPADCGVTVTPGPGRDAVRPRAGRRGACRTRRHPGEPARARRQLRQAGPRGRGPDRADPAALGEGIGHPGVPVGDLPRLLGRRRQDRRTRRGPQAVKERPGRARRAAHRWLRAAVRAERPARAAGPGRHRAPAGDPGDRGRHHAPGVRRGDRGDLGRGDGLGRGRRSRWTRRPRSWHAAGRWWPASAPTWRRRSPKPSPPSTPRAPRRTPTRLPCGTTGRTDTSAADRARERSRRSRRGSPSSPGCGSRPSGGSPAWPRPPPSLARRAQRRGRRRGARRRHGSPCCRRCLPTSPSRRWPPSARSRPAASGAGWRRSSTAARPSWPGPVSRPTGCARPRPRPSTSAMSCARCCAPTRPRPAASARSRNLGWRPAMTRRTPCCGRRRATWRRPSLPWSAYQRAILEGDGRR